MIKINHSDKNDLNFKTYSEEHRDAILNAPYNIVDRLKKFAAAHKISSRPKRGQTISARNEFINAHSQFVNELIGKEEEILTSSPRALNLLAEKIKPKYDIALQRVFNYDLFVGEPKPTKKRLTYYYAYDLAKKLNVIVCPYCNRQYTFTLKTSDGKTRPEFDHFYSKGEHPYFALSFYNLVPSCHICNSSLKGSDEFTTKTHLNPFSNCFNDVLKFEIGITSADYINNGKDFTIDIVPFDSRKKNTAVVKRALNNAKTFHLEKLYRLHKDLVIELIRKAYYYDSTRRKELEKALVTGTSTPLFKKDEIDRYITGVYTDYLEHGKRPMSKLITDIGKELGLLKP
jgi:hypothetical protein